jgi:hypothetical protein
MVRKMKCLMIFSLTDSISLLSAYEVLYLLKISLQVVTGGNKIHDIGFFEELVKKFPTYFREHEGSSQCSQMPAIRPYLC